MTLNGKQYDETDPRELVQIAVDIADELVEAYGTVYWSRCLDDSARNMRRLAHAMDLMRESTTYVEHNDTH